jgi:hypothetical protein
MREFTSAAAGVAGAEMVEVEVVAIGIEWSGVEG